MDLPKVKDFCPDTLVVEYEDGTDMQVPYTSWQDAQTFLTSGKDVRKYYIKRYNPADYLED